jgi:hypothetical protein
MRTGNNNHHHYTWAGGGYYYQVGSKGARRSLSLTPYSLTLVKECFGGIQSNNNHHHLYLYGGGYYQAMEG